MSYNTIEKWPLHCPQLGEATENVLGGQAYQIYEDPLDILSALSALSAEFNEFYVASSALMRPRIAEAVDATRRRCMPRETSVHAPSKATVAARDNRDFGMTSRSPDFSCSGREFRDSVYLNDDEDITTVTVRQYQAEGDLTIGERQFVFDQQNVAVQVDIRRGSNGVGMIYWPATATLGFEYEASPEEREPQINAIYGLLVSL